MSLAARRLTPSRVTRVKINADYGPSDNASTAVARSVADCRELTAKAIEAITSMPPVSAGAAVRKSAKEPAPS